MWSGIGSVPVGDARLEAAVDAIHPFARGGTTIGDLMAPVALLLPHVAQMPERAAQLYQRHGETSGALILLCCAQTVGELATVDASDANSVALFDALATPHGVMHLLVATAAATSPEAAPDVRDALGAMVLAWKALSRRTEGPASVLRWGRGSGGTRLGRVKEASDADRQALARLVVAAVGRFAPAEAVAIVASVLDADEMRAVSGYSFPEAVAGVEAFSAAAVFEAHRPPDAAAHLLACAPCGPAASAVVRLLGTRNLGPRDAALALLTAPPPEREMPDDRAVLVSTVPCVVGEVAQARGRAFVDDVVRALLQRGPTALAAAARSKDLLMRLTETTRRVTGTGPIPHELCPWGCVALSAAHEVASMPFHANGGAGPVLARGLVNAAAFLDPIGRPVPPEILDVEDDAMRGLQDVPPMQRGAVLLLLAIAAQHRVGRTGDWPAEADYAAMSVARTAFAPSATPTVAEPAALLPLLQALRQPLHRGAIDPVRSVFAAWLMRDTARRCLDDALGGDGDIAKRLLPLLLGLPTGAMDTAVDGVREDPAALAGWHDWTAPPGPLSPIPMRPAARWRLVAQVLVWTAHARFPEHDAPRAAAARLVRSDDCHSLLVQWTTLGDGLCPVHALWSAAHGLSGKTAPATATASVPVGPRALALARRNEGEADGPLADPVAEWIELAVATGVRSVAPSDPIARQLVRDGLVPGGDEEGMRDVNNLLGLAGALFVGGRGAAHQRPAVRCSLTEAWGRAQAKYVSAGIADDEAFAQLDDAVARSDAVEGAVHAWRNRREAECRGLARRLGPASAHPHPMRPCPALLDLATEVLRATVRAARLGEDPAGDRRQLQAARAAVAETVDDAAFVASWQRDHAAGDVLWVDDGTFLPVWEGDPFAARTDGAVGFVGIRQALAGPPMVAPVASDGRLHGLSRYRRSGGSVACAGRGCLAPLSDRPRLATFMGPAADLHQALSRSGHAGVAEFLESVWPDAQVAGNLPREFAGYPAACVAARLRAAGSAPETVAVSPAAFDWLRRTAAPVMGGAVLRWQTEVGAGALPLPVPLAVSVRLPSGRALVVVRGYHHLCPAEQLAFVSGDSGNTYSLVWSASSRAAWLIGAQPAELCPLDALGLLRWDVLHGMPVFIGTDVLQEAPSSGARQVARSWTEFVHAPDGSAPAVVGTGSLIGCLKAAAAYRKQREDPRWGPDADAPFDPLAQENFGTDNAFVPPWLHFLAEGNADEAAQSARVRSRLAQRRLSSLLWRTAEPQAALGWLSGRCGARVVRIGASDAMHLPTRSLMLWRAAGQVTAIGAVPMCPWVVARRQDPTDPGQRAWRDYLRGCTTEGPSWSGLPFFDTVDNATVLPDDDDPYGQLGGEGEGAGLSRWHGGQVPIGCVLVPDGASGGGQRWLPRCCHLADLVLGPRLAPGGMCEWLPAATERWDPQSTLGAYLPRDRRRLLRLMVTSTSAWLADPHATQAVAVALDAWSAWEDVRADGGLLGFLLGPLTFALRRGPDCAIVGNCDGVRGQSMLHGQYCDPVYWLDRPTLAVARQVLRDDTGPFASVALDRDAALASATAFFTDTNTTFDSTDSGGTGSTPGTPAFRTPKRIRASV